MAESVYGCMRVHMVNGARFSALTRILNARPSTFYTVSPIQKSQFVVFVLRAVSVFILTFDWPIHVFETLNAIFLGVTIAVSQI